MKLSTLTKTSQTINIASVVLLLVAAVIAVIRSNYGAAFAWVVAVLWAGTATIAERSRDRWARRYFRAVGFKEDEV